VIARHEGDHRADFRWDLEPLEERAGPSPREEVLLDFLLMLRRESVPIRFIEYLAHPVAS